MQFYVLCYTNWIFPAYQQLANYQYRCETKKMAKHFAIATKPHLYHETNIGYYLIDLQYIK